MADPQQDVMVRRELDALETTVAGTATWTSLDALGRSEYNRLTKRLSDEIWAQYKAGRLSAEKAAGMAAQLRNEVMEAVRAKSSPWGAARARQLKTRGKTLADLLDKYARQTFRKPFEALGDAQWSTVFEAVIKAAGRPNPQVNAAARMLGRIGRVFWVVTFVVLIWDVATAKDKIRTAIRDVVGMAAGIGGSILVGAAAGTVFGPIGTILGGIVGGVLFSLFTDSMFDAVGADGAAPGEVSPADAMLRSLI